MKVKSLSRVQLSATPWTAAYQAPLSMGFSRQEYWSGVPLASPIFIYIYTCIYSCLPLKKLQVLLCPLKHVYTSVNQVPPLPVGLGGIHKIGSFLQFLIKF